jgi:hypothetical protein
MNLVSAIHSQHDGVGKMNLLHHIIPSLTLSFQPLLELRGIVKHSQAVLSYRSVRHMLVAAIRLGYKHLAALPFILFPRTVFRQTQ